VSGSDFFHPNKRRLIIEFVAICATPFRVDFEWLGFPRVRSAALGFVVEPLRGKIVDCGATVAAYAAVGRS
jgi:hypothetical protein